MQTDEQLTAYSNRATIIMNENARLIMRTATILFLALIARQHAQHRCCRVQVVAVGVRHL